ncbi:nucleoredoxin-like protein 2 isoform X3 [Eurytemora carolleeae]|uniref:nucleoredoxin-like protein 2 isoform X3 n=1 Tax=Eurytemora carolleeae TaxID=1294199 RepID=UPI000C78AC37|nr:nucleoredoxin-like protein 2 isoform X3 [Eurytemora carolleeae]|eukprot:XP_023340806.1 nucleoredoxin-like protein 2 isoform X3 [Eurytemora affinis]
MDSLAGQQLVKADGTSVNADEALADKELVLYYFSAHWCPPCRQFTPKLKDFYEEVSDEGVEIVFVSSDESNEDMLSYMKESHGDWLAIEHNSNLTNSLNEKYEVDGIPTLVVCKKDGTVITKDGRDHVMSKQPAQAVKDWKN